MLCKVWNGASRKIHLNYNFNFVNDEFRFASFQWICSLTVIIPSALFVAVVRGFEEQRYKSLTFLNRRPTPWHDRLKCSSVSRDYFRFINLSKQLQIRQLIQTASVSSPWRKKSSTASNHLFDTVSIKSTVVWAVNVPPIRLRDAFHSGG